MPDLASSLARVKGDGGRAFVPYVTGGLPGVDEGLLRDLAAAGADAIEVGLPFSDPVMDGAVIQESSRRALAAGATPGSILKRVGNSGVDVPVALMTYVNPVLAYGIERFASDAAAAGVSGVIVPDLPVDEADDWLKVAAASNLSPILLAAPNSAPARLRLIAEASRGFVYCVSTMGVTGARDALAGSAHGVIEALRPLTDTPLLVGVGISTPDQAAAAAAFADGVIVGSALVEPLLRGDRPEALRRAVSIRAALGRWAGSD
jgi:tryptophan synthase alpha chain